MDRNLIKFRNSEKASDVEVDLYICISFRWFSIACSNHYDGGLIMRLARVDGQLTTGYMPVFDLFVDCHCLVDWMYFLIFFVFFVNRFHALFLKCNGMHLEIAHKYDSRTLNAIQLDP